jgi:hypothetical protein
VLFITEWDKIEDEMLKQLKSKQQVAEDQFKDIGQLYRENSRSICNIDLERALISMYKDLDINVLRNYLHSKTDFLFFNFKTINPSIDFF